MMQNSSPSALRRVYDGLSIFALLNIVGLVGLLVILSNSGAINIEKLRRIAGVMRGEESVQPAGLAGSDGGGTKEASSGNAEGNEQAAGAASGDSNPDVQIIRLEGERIRAELDQRLALNNSILLRVTTERERFQRERDANQKLQDQARMKRQTQGFKKQIAIYEALSPKVAIEHLLSLPDPADAAAIFLEMDTRKAKKIVEAAKRADQKETVMEILRRVREVEPEKFKNIEDGDG